MRLQKNHFPVCSSSPEKEHKQNIVPPAARTRLRPRPAPGTPSRTRARTWHRAVGLLLTHPPGASLCLKSAFPLSRNTSRLLESLIRRVEGWSIPVSPPWEGCPCPTAWSHNKFWSQALLHEALRDQQHPPNWQSPSFIVGGEQTFGPKDEEQRGQQDLQQIMVLSP